MDISAAENNKTSLLSLDQLLDCVCGSVAGGFDPSCFCFTSVVTDSRSVVPGCLFVPLIGEFQDGHVYIPQALEKGASAVFVARSFFEKNPEKIGGFAKNNPKTAFIVVENTLTALQNAARRYVEKFPDLIRVSVTGSSGKTTTKELAASVLREKFRVVCNKGNLNSETGLPLSCFEIRSEHQLALLEMGMNRENEIGELAETFKPQYCVITNIGTAHIGKLGSRQKIAEEKKKIFNFLTPDGTALIPAGDDFAEFLAQDIKGRVVFYGKDVKDRGIEFVSDEGIEGTVFKIDGETVHLAIPGSYNYLNALAAVELGRALGLSARQIKDGIEKLHPLDGRSRILRGKYKILEDCYNANPDSMEKALEFAGSVKTSGKKIFVLGSMLELGQESFEAHRKAGLEAVKGGADMIVFVGKDMAAGFESAKSAKTCGQGTENLRLEYFEASDESSIKKIAGLVEDFASEGDFILLKASHGIALERLVPLLNGANGGEA